MILRKFNLAYAALGKDVLGNGDSGEGVRPARIERKMRDDLGQFTGRYAIIEGQVEVVHRADRLIASDQRRYGHNATIAPR